MDSETGRALVREMQTQNTLLRKVVKLLEAIADSSSNTAANTSPVDDDTTE